MDYTFAALIGVLVGSGELVARYRDAPLKALASVPAALYLALNGVAAALALSLVQSFNVKLGFPDGSSALRWARVMVAGFGAMAVFRSSVFTVRVGEQDIGIGPSSLLQVVLGAADRAVDRVRATARAARVAAIMKGVSYNEAHDALPAYCLALMQNLPEEEQGALGKDVASLSRSAMAEEVKVLNLGLALMNVVGPGVLQAAVESLGSRIKRPTT